MLTSIKCSQCMNTTQIYHVFMVNGYSYCEECLKKLNEHDINDKLIREKNEKRKYPTKAQLMWEISREMEADFMKNLFPSTEGFISQIELNKEEVIELFKAIRSAEYRRGKEDGAVNE